MVAALLVVTVWWSTAALARRLHGGCRPLLTRSQQPSCKRRVVGVVNTRATLASGGYVVFERS
jgi:hypothetical protein